MDRRAFLKALALAAGAVSTTWIAPGRPTLTAVWLGWTDDAWTGHVVGRAVCMAGPETMFAGTILSAPTDSPETVAAKIANLWMSLESVLDEHGYRMAGEFPRVA